MLTVEHPTQPAEAQQRRSALGAGGSFIGGGTALQLAWGDAAPALTLVDVTRLAEAHGIAVSQRASEPEPGSTLRIGAATRLETLRRDPLVRRHAPLLGAACDEIAALSVRHLATLGGNVGWGFGDTLAVLLALGAQAELADGTQVSIPALLAMSELPLVVALRIDIAHAPAFCFYEKVGRRAAFSPSRLALSISADIDASGRWCDLRAAGCGAGLRARRLAQVEQLLMQAAPMAAIDRIQLREACAHDLPEDASLARLAAGVIGGHLATWTATATAPATARESR